MRQADVVALRRIFRRFRRRVSEFFRRHLRRERMTTIGAICPPPPEDSGFDWPYV